MDIVDRLKQWTRVKNSWPARSLDDDIEDAIAEIIRLRVFEEWSSVSSLKTLSPEIIAASKARTE